MNTSTTMADTVSGGGLRSDEARPWQEIIRPGAWVQIAVLAVLAIWLFWEPLRYTVVQRWIDDGNWSHGWLVPAFSLYLLHARRGELGDAIPRTNSLGLVIVLLAVAIYFGTYIRPITYARPLCFLATLFGLVLFLGGWSVMRIAWFPIAFLWFCIPLPHHLYVDLTMPLRRIATVVAASLMSLVPGVHTDVSGVVIDYTYGGSRDSLNVEEACSGMRLLMALVTLGVAMAYLVPRPAWHRAVMVILCVPIAVFCNILRVTATGLLHVFKNEPIGQQWGFESLTRGTPHALIGLAVLPIALGLYALVGWVLSNLVVEEDTEPGEAAA